MIELDGSSGEGGGQILRTALALAICTGQPVQIERIRAGRAKPGLMRQHLACVQAAARISGAQIHGAELGSQAIRFEPGVALGGDYRFDVGSAGSCLLVLQTVLPPLLQAVQPSRIVLSGGTHNPMAPPFQFIERAFVPLLRRMGAGVSLNLRRHGFYPAGGGELEVEIQPASGGLKPMELTQRNVLQEAYAEALVAGIARSVGGRELETLGLGMGWSGDQLRLPPLRQNEGPGNALIATLQYEHHAEVFTEFGEKSLSAEQVAKRLLAQLRDFQKSDAAVGPYLADQLALPMALAGGGAYTASEITPHAQTNFAVIEKFLPVSFEQKASRAGTLVTVR